MCLQTTAEEEDKWGSVVRTDHQFFQEFVDDNENTKSLAEATHTHTYITVELPVGSVMS